MREEVYYLGDLVKREIARFSRGRWVAVHVKTRRGLVFRRYEGSCKKPLTVSKPGDVGRLVALGARSFYASICIYKRLGKRSDTYDLGNIVAVTPTWDVDVRSGSWRGALALTERLVSLLEKLGVYKSVFVKFSGRGFHVHLHQGCFSPKLLSRIHPLDLAYSVVEYVKDRLKHGETPNLKVKVENKIDLARVFTCPLSLHRELDRACVCVNPDELPLFDISWANPEKPKHYTGWDRFEVGEGDDLAEKAYREVGGYPQPTSRRRGGFKRLEELVEEFLGELDARL